MTDRPTCAGLLLTDAGRIAFDSRSDDERRIIVWLLSQDQDMPWRAEDIAEMILNGDHEPKEQSNG